MLGALCEQKDYSSHILYNSLQVKEAEGIHVPSDELMKLNLCEQAVMLRKGIFNGIYGSVNTCKLEANSVLFCLLFTEKLPFS